MPTEMKKKLLDQLRHVDATPKILNDVETAVVGAVRHLRGTLCAAQEIERKLCKQNGIKLPRKRS